MNLCHEAQSHTFLEEEGYVAGSKMRSVAYPSPVLCPQAMHVRRFMLMTSCTIERDSLNLHVQRRFLPLLAVQAC